jgi:hypothetical protein
LLHRVALNKYHNQEKGIDIGRIRTYALKE